MKCASLIRAVEADLDAERSAVIQPVSTDEALMPRRIAEITASEWEDLNVELTPRHDILPFLMHAFPAQLQKPFASIQDPGAPAARNVETLGKLSASL